MGKRLLTQSPQCCRAAALVLIALLLAATPSLAQEARLDGKARPSEQSVFLEVDPALEAFSGRTEIAVTLEQNAVLRLHAQDITIRSAALLAGETSTALSVKAAEDGTVTLAAPGPTHPGTYRLLMEFTGPFNKRSSGLYKYSDQGRPYLSTQFEMSHARLCFPCFDEPAFKIPFQLTVEAPTDQKVYSNTPETKSVARGENTVHTFAQTPPMPPYLVALAVGPFESVEVKGLSVPGRIVTPRGKLELSAFARKVTPPILDALQSYFGIAYPYAKLDQIAITEFPHGAMENAGMVTYREDILLVNERTAQEDTRTATVMVIAHELSHQWFGNLVTMKWWNDLWLNEAFATWMAAKVVVQLYPEMEYALNTPQNRVMTGDASLSTKPIRKPIRNEADIFDGLSLAYNKGGAVLNMIERWIGEKTFQAGIQAYLGKHRFGNAEAADLWSALGQESGKDVESVLKTFTEQSGYPLIAMAANGETLEIAQTRFLNYGVKGPGQLWTLPLFIRYGAGGKTAVATVLLDSPSTTVKLEFAPEWIFPDDGAVGYFRWSLSKADLQALLGRKDRLTNREKLAVIHNLNALFKAGSITAGEALGYNSAFLSEQHPSVVALALSSLDGYRRTFVNESNREGWRAFLQAAIAPVVQRFGLAPRAGEPLKVQTLRPLLLTFLAEDIGDQKLIDTATGQAQAYINSPTASVDPALADTYLMIAARHAGTAMVDDVKAALVEATDPQRRTALLSTLGMFGEADAQNKALALMMDPAVTASDLRTLLRQNSVEEARRQRLFAWLQENYDVFVGKLPTPFLGEVPSSVSAAKNRDDLKAVLDFFAKQPDPSGALQRESAKIQEQTSATIADRERGQESFDAYLRNVKP